MAMMNQHLKKGHPQCINRQKNAQKAVEKTHTNHVRIATRKSTSAVAAFSLFDSPAIGFQRKGGVCPTITKQNAPKVGTFMQPSHSHSNLSVRPVSEHQQGFVISEENVWEGGFWRRIVGAAAENVACYGTKSGKFYTTVGGKNLSEVVFRGFAGQSVVDIAITLAELSILEGYAAKARALM